MQNFFSNLLFPSSLRQSEVPAQAKPSHVEENAALGKQVRDSAREDLLVASPYTSRAHLLDLATLTQSQALLAKALTSLTPSTHQYATLPYTSSFNWDTVFNSLAEACKDEAFLWPEQFFYVVIFRSQIPPTTDRTHLAELDERAHAEAMKSGGLLKYWFGIPDADGRNLATCRCRLLTFPGFESTAYPSTGVWRHREDAHPGSSGEGHKAAMRATINMYSEWHIERRKLRVGNGVKEWDMLPWTD
ncbi:MAG: hypothetical protein Q9220_001243 [cf. Caloplaca sp. 1 TL-2023]